MRFRVCPLLLVLILGLMKEMLTCPKGFEREGKKGPCIDYDECALEENICGQNANCKNTNGSYYCTCHEGFEPRVHFTQEDGTKCRDFNECRANRTVCGANAECHNTVGSYQCRCKLGYNSSDGSEKFKAGRGVQCIDMDECINSSVCGIKRECHNTPGGFYCSCGAGFRLDPGQTNSTETSKSCRKIKCEDFIIDNTAKQKVPDLTKLVSVMNNSCVLLGNSEIVRNHSIQMDGKTLLEGFLNALDDLLQGELQDFHSKASTVFSIVESMMKLAGALLDKGHTRTSKPKTEVEMFVNRESPSSGGPLMVSVSGAQFSSHWDTAAGNTNLGTLTVTDYIVIVHDKSASLYKFKLFFYRYYIILGGLMGYRHLQDGEGFVTAALLSYSGLEESLSSFSDDLGKGQFKINSKVVTATVSNPETEHLDKPVTLTFTHLQRSDRTHVCVFWDPKVKQGAWSASGCTRVNSTEDQTICSCDHLSSFAVLMALYDIGDVYELSVVTWVGLSLSLICLLICIATFYLVRSIQSTRNTIHLHLSICLFIAYFVFLVGINRTENEVGCSVVAVVLHYSFLASFCWMCLEGVQLFRMVVLVFDTTVRPLYLFVAGYGVPAVIVSVSAMVKAGGYGTESYCWLSLKDGFIWSFYGPVCLIIMANAFFFLITIWKLAEKFSSLNPDLNNLRKIKTFTITAVAQLCVLGLTWVFGCFQFDSSSLATSYIFTILGSLQGALMFLMHCCLSKQVKEEYAKVLSCFHTPQKRKYSEFSSNQTGKTQPSRSAQHTGESHF